MILGHGKPSPPRPPPTPSAPVVLGGWLSKATGTQSTKANATLATALAIVICGVIAFEVRHRMKRSKLSQLRALAASRAKATRATGKGGGGFASRLFPWNQVNENGHRAKPVPLEDPDEAPSQASNAKRATIVDGVFGGARRCAAEDSTVKAPRAKTNGGPVLVIQLCCGKTRTLALRTKHLKSMNDLQEAVIDACQKGLSEDEQSQAQELVMKAVNSDGVEQTVTGAIKIKTLLQCRELRLMPRDGRVDDISPAEELVVVDVTEATLHMPQEVPIIPPPPPSSLAPTTHALHLGGTAPSDNVSTSGVDVIESPPNVSQAGGEALGSAEPVDLPGDAHGGSHANVTNSAQSAIDEDDDDELLSSHLSANSRPGSHIAFTRGSSTVLSRGPSSCSHVTALSQTDVERVRVMREQVFGESQKGMAATNASTLRPSAGAECSFSLD